MAKDLADTLLLIVDSETKASRLIKALEPEGYQFEVIEHLEVGQALQDAREKFPHHGPSLVILWFSYSSPDALENLAALIQSVKQLDATHELPVLLIVDQDGTQFIEPGFKLGVADILSRPIHPLVLRHRVRLILQARRTEEAETRFRTVADFTYDWEYWKSVDGRLLYNSPACERITGFKPDTFIREPATLLRIVDPLDKALIQRHFEDEREDKGVFSIDFRIRTLDGSERWIGHVCQPVFSASGQFLGRRVSNRDITDRKAAEENSLRSEKLAAIGKLTASLAHEINNPLQAMVSSLELLTTFSLPQEEQKRYLQISSDEVERLIRITRGILDYSRPASGDPEYSNLNQIIEQALFLASHQMQSSGIQIQLEIANELPPILVWADQVKQVCLNLIINALEHMPAGGTLRIHAWYQDGQEWVEFCDSGSGIPGEDLERIFDPFFTTKNDGTGLGLAISQQIMFRHKGQIRVTSQYGQGATFTINFPVSQPRDSMENEWII